MKFLKWAQIAVDYQDYTDETQEYADMVADNAIAEWSALNLEDIKEKTSFLEDFDLELLGLKQVESIPLENYEESFGDWDGMPDMGDNTGTTEKAFGRVIVWFESEAFFNEFKKVINQEFTLGKKSITNSIWFPKK